MELASVSDCALMELLVLMVALDLILMKQSVTYHRALPGHHGENTMNVP